MVPAGDLLSISRVIGYIREKFNAVSPSFPSHKSTVLLKVEYSSDNFQSNRSLDF